MISEITITCFAASYLVAFVLEASRLLFRGAIRNLAILVFAVAGLLAHSLYLVVQARAELAAGNVAPLSSWYDFCVLAAWVVAGAYLGLSLRRPQNNVGLFLLPLVLALIGVGVLFQDARPFAKQDALWAWRLIHGLTLLLGTVAVTLGFATGVMYLVQAYRLKHKMPPRRGLKLPSLEWLQRFNGEVLLLSTGLLAVGLVSGVMLNLIRRTSAAGVPWTDPVVLSSGVLFAWLAVVTVFESVYKPARQGRKVAYLTLASFLFLVMALCFVLVGEHAGQSHNAQRHEARRLADSNRPLEPGRPTLAGGRP